MIGWIKLHRSLIDWEWYKKSEYMHVFIHLILKANIEDKKWQNFDIKRGQLITSIDKICIETGVPNKVVRNALDKLILSNEIVKQTTNKFTIITICKYDSYQQDGQTKGEQKGKQRATTKEYKNNINKLILRDFLENNIDIELIKSLNITDIETKLLKAFYSVLTKKHDYLNKKLNLKSNLEAIRELYEIAETKGIVAIILYIHYFNNNAVFNNHIKNMKSISYLLENEKTSGVARYTVLLEDIEKYCEKNTEFTKQLITKIKEYSNE